MTQQLQSANCNRVARWFAKSRGRYGKVMMAFHRDQDGLKSVEMLLIIFIAAIILIAFIKVFFPEVLTKVKGKVMELLGMSAG